MGNLRRRNRYRRSRGHTLRARNLLGTVRNGMTHSFSSRVTIPSDVLFRLVGEEAVLLNLKTELYLGLDAIGTRMWAVLTDMPSIQAAYDALLQEYEVEPKQLREDLDDFLDRLLAQGLIQLGPGELAV